MPGRNSPWRSVALGVVIVALVSGAVLIARLPQSTDPGESPTSQASGGQPRSKASLPVVAADEPGAVVQATVAEPEAPSLARPARSRAPGWHTRSSTGESPDETPEDEAKIHRQVASLQLRALVKERRGDREAAWRLRRRMAKLRDKLPRKNTPDLVVRRDASGD